MDVIITDCDHASMEIEQDILATAGLSHAQYKCRTEAEMIDTCAGVPVLLNQYGPLSARVLEALAPDLRLVARYGVGVDHVDLTAASRLGIQVCNVPDYGMHEVSDHAIAMMLTLVRKLPQTVELCRAGVWDYRRAIPIHRMTEMTVGVLGGGRIGTLFARKALAFGATVRLHDPYSDDVPPDVEPTSFDDLLATSDVISVHCPLNAETRGLIGREEMLRMRPGSYIVNTARGGLVDEVALAEALASGHLAGAGIDTVEEEPISPSSPLLKQANCLVTPHMAWYSEEAAREMKERVAEEAVRFFKGQQPRCPANTPTGSSIA